MIIIIVCSILFDQANNRILFEDTSRYALLYHTEDVNQSFSDTILFHDLYKHSINDVLQLCNLKEQIEDAGAYNPNKKIDVTAFAYRYETIPDSYITIEYKLGDMLSWAEEGFEFQKVTLSGKEAAAYLGDVTEYTYVDFISSSYDKKDCVTIYNSDILKHLVKNRVENLPYSEQYLSSDHIQNLLTERYKSAEGKAIANYVSDFKEYDELKLHIANTASELYRNYQMYLTYKQVYDAGHSNIKYYIVRHIRDEEKIYTNWTEGERSKDPYELAKKTGSYIFINPSQRTFSTNTNMTQEDMLTIVNQYMYSYPENTDYIFVVDSKMSNMDSFYEAGLKYKDYHSYHSLLKWIAILCSLMSFTAVVLYLHFNYKETNIYNYLPTELLVFAGCFLFATCICIGAFVFGSNQETYFYSWKYRAVCALLFVFYNAMIMGWLNTIVGCITCDELWNRSWTKSIFERLKKLRRF